MSLASKLTLAGTSLGAVGIVVFVHFAQKSEKAAMHKGVERDMEQRRLKQERQADFDAQRKLEEEYRKVQAVSDSSKGSAGNGKDSGKEDKQSGKGIEIKER